MILTTDAAKGNLHKIGVADGLKMFVVPDGVGRTLLRDVPRGSAGCGGCGIDIEEMLAGAASMDARCQSDDYLKNPALLAAGAMICAMEKA